MLDRLRELLRPAGPSAPDDATGGPDPLHVAACALLLDVAHADGEFSAVERERLDGALARQFGLAPEVAREVVALAEAERAQAVDHFAFTSTLAREYDVGQKRALAEALWAVALADGVVADHEHYLTRKIANFLDLAPEEQAAARRAAEARTTG